MYWLTSAVTCPISWVPTGTFITPSMMPHANVHISIDAIDTAGGTATITLDHRLALSPHVPEVLHPFGSRQ
jgi:hypothetical protein